MYPAKTSSLPSIIAYSKAPNRINFNMANTTSTQLIVQVFFKEIFGDRWVTLRVETGTGIKIRSSWQPLAMKRGVTSSTGCSWFNNLLPSYETFSLFRTYADGRASVILICPSFLDTRLGGPVMGMWSSTLFLPLGFSDRISLHPLFYLTSLIWNSLS